MDMLTMLMMNTTIMTQSKTIDSAERFTPSTKVLQTFSQMDKITLKYHLTSSMRVTLAPTFGSQWKRERTGCSQEADVLSR